MPDKMKYVVHSVETAVQLAKLEELGWEKDQSIPYNPDGPDNIKIYSLIKWLPGEKENMEASVKALKESEELLKGKGELIDQISVPLDTSESREKAKKDGLMTPSQEYIAQGYVAISNTSKDQVLGKYRKPEPPAILLKLKKVETENQSLKMQLSDLNLAFTNQSEVLADLIAENNMLKSAPQQPISTVYVNPPAQVQSEAVISEPSKLEPPPDKVVLKTGAGATVQEIPVEITQDIYNLPSARPAPKKPEGDIDRVALGCDSCILEAEKGACNDVLKRVETEQLKDGWPHIAYCTTRRVE